MNPTAPAPASNPLKTKIVALIAVLALLGIGATIYLNSAASPKLKGSPNEAPPSLSAAGGGLKGSFTEQLQGFRQYEATDITAFETAKPTLAAKFGSTPGTLKGNAATNYMIVNATDMTFEDFVNNNNPKAEANKALFIIYSAGQYMNGATAMPKGFYTYPAGPFGSATTEVKKEDLKNIKLPRYSGVIMLSRADGENYGVLEATATPSGTYATPLLPDDKSGWVLVAGNGKLADLIGTQKDRVIAAWALKDATNFEKVDMNTYTFSTFHMVWLNVLPKSTVTDVTPTPTPNPLIGQTVLAHYNFPGTLATVQWFPAKVTATKKGSDGKDLYNYTFVNKVVGSADGKSFAINPNITPGDSIVDDYETNIAVLVDAPYLENEKDLYVIAKAANADLYRNARLNKKNADGTYNITYLDDNGVRDLALSQIYRPLGAKIKTVATDTATNKTGAPTITSISVKEGISGYLARFEITGTNLNTATALSLGGLGIGGTPLSNLTATSAHAEFIINTNIPLGQQVLAITNPSGTFEYKYFTVNAKPISIFKPLINIDLSKLQVPTITSTNVNGVASSEAFSGKLIKLTVFGTNMKTVTSIKIGNGDTASTPLSTTDTTAEFEFFISITTPLGPNNLVVTNAIGTSANWPFTIKKEEPASTKSLGAPSIDLVKTTVTPKFVLPGGTTILTIVGSNLKDAILSGNNLTLKDEANEEGFRSITVTVAANAASGPRDIMIKNANGAYTWEKAFTVIAPAAPAMPAAPTTPAAPAADANSGWNVKFIE